MSTENYGAICAKIENVQPIKGADNIQAGTCQGYPVVVGVDVQEGDTGILIREGSQLSKEFCLANGLYTKHPDTLEPLGGYLGTNGRVRALTLRGQRSEGIWIKTSEGPFDFLYGACEAQAIFVGVPFDQVRDHVFVCKYETPRQKREQKEQGKQKKKAPRFNPYEGFSKHYDTAQLRNTSNTTPPGIAIWTEKVHGTSGRTMRGEFPLEQSWVARTWNRFMGWAFVFEPDTEEQTVSGTRNCIVKQGDTGEKGKDYRQRCHEYLSKHTYSGETIYYEIVGYEGSGKPIMPSHDVEGCKDLPSKLRKALKKRAVNGRMNYAYGCDPMGHMLTADAAPGSMEANPPRFRILIYRITDMLGEMSWEELKLRVSQFSIPEVVGHVPELLVHTYPYADCKNGADIVETANRLSRDYSTLDERHIKEGVCLRMETENEDGVVTVYHSRKHKSFPFCVLEGFGIVNDEYIDPEAIA